MTELMTSARASSTESRVAACSAGETLAAPSAKPSVGSRDGLGAYLASPTSFPTRIVYHTTEFVAVRDAFPKSSVHLLLLPYTQLSKVHPIEAFDRDPSLLAACKAEAAKAVTLVASELRHHFGRFSAQDRARFEAMEQADLSPDGDGGTGQEAGEGPKASLPLGRDWEREVLTGVHAGPSMNHLHVHVLSRDRRSPFLRHRKHYNSFATPFLISLDEFPLAPDDARRQPMRGGYSEADLICWRCGKNFGRRFKNLKAHIEDVEFKEWKQV